MKGCAFKKRAFAFGAALTVTAASVSAAVIVQDDFESYTLGSLNGQASGAGWAAPWVATGTSVLNVVDTSADPLEFDIVNGNTSPFTLSGGSRALQITGNNLAAARRQFASSYNGDELLVSVLFRVEPGTLLDPEPSANPPQDLVIYWVSPTVSGGGDDLVTGIDANGGPGTPEEEFFARVGTVTTFVPGAKGDIDPTEIGDTYLIVASYQKSVPGPTQPYDQFQMWVNPPFDDSLAVGPPVNRPPADITSTMAGGPSSVEWVGFGGAYLNKLGSTNDAYTFDRFHVATDWASVFDEPVSLLIDLRSFEAETLGAGEPVTLTWETASELDNAGFNIYRQEDGGSMVKLNSGLIPANGDEFTGAAYTFTDSTVDPSATEVANYYLEDVDIYGVTTLHGPAGVKSSTTTVGDWILFEE